MLQRNPEFLTWKRQRKSVVVLGILILREEEKGQVLPVSREESTRDNFNSIDGNLKINERKSTKALPSTNINESVTAEHQPASWSPATVGGSEPCCRWHLSWNFVSMMKFMLTVLTRSHLKYQEPRDILEFPRVLTPPHKMETLEIQIFPKDAGIRTRNSSPFWRRYLEKV